MRIDILTLFDNLFSEFVKTSIIKRAIENGKVTINVHNFREYSLSKHGRVDDYPYGGGAGMVLMCEPIFRAIDAIKTEDSKVIMMSPSGKVFNQKMAVDLSHEKHLIIICGHYEGFDERIRSICDMEISIGDYVLTGGEVPAMVLVDSVARLIPGVINERSHLGDSFSESYLLDYPTYTKPRVFEGMEVPEVLVSGDHKRIAEYRLEESIKKTKLRRPDLLEK